jgi:hypothetical protein
MYVERNTETRSRFVVAEEKQYYIFVCTYACVRVGYLGSVHVALLIQHATRMRYVVTFVAPLGPPCFSTLSHKRVNFREKVIELKVCAFVFSTTFV